MINWNDYDRILVIEEMDGYKQVQAREKRTDSMVIINEFKLSNILNKDIAWNDFYFTIEMLKKLGRLDLLWLHSYGVTEERDVFHYIIRLDLNSVTWKEYENGQKYAPFHHLFKDWLSLVSHVQQIHSLMLVHGALNENEILLMNKGGIQFFFPTALLWRFRQIFAITENDEKGYRDQGDDRYSLGVLLYQMIFPSKPVPKHEEELVYISDQIHPDIFAILQYLLFPVENISLSFILELGERFLQDEMNKLIFSIDFSDEYMDHLGEHSPHKWEQLFLEDVQDHTYLFTSYQKELNVSMLHVIGEQYEWRFVIPPRSVAVDLWMYSSSVLTNIERERLREKGFLFNGKWQFNKKPIRSNKKAIELLKTQSIDQSSKTRKKMKTRAAFEQWSSWLDLELNQLLSDDNRYAFHSWKTIEDESSIEVELFKKILLPFTFGDEIILASEVEEIKVGTFVKQENHVLTILLDRHVNLETIPSFGDLYSNQMLETVQIRRQKEILQKFRYGEMMERKLLDALIDPQSVRINPKTLLHTFQSLNSDQENALLAALGTESLFLLQGPPGTGKTTWITELILQIYKINPKARIMISSQSNVAIDHAFEKVLNFINKHKDIFREVPTAVRIGHESKMSQYAINWNVDEALQRWVEQLDERVHTNIWTILEGAMDDTKRYDNLMKIYDEWRNVLQKNEEIKPLYFSQGPILVGATCMGSYPFTRWGQEFDWIIVDEAARATPPEILVPTIVGKKAVFVGDHKQLPPVVESSTNEIVQAELKISLFEDLFHKLDSSAKSTLVTQYRMNEVISQLISDLFYQETPLKNGVSPKERKLKLGNWQPLNWIYIDEHPDEMEISVGTSYYNKSEIETIQKLLMKLNEQCKQSKLEKSVAIITGYTPQKERLKEAISSLTLPNLTIEIDTVDAFQGREADIVIYSIVRNNTKRNIGFLRDEKRLNVMLSRSKEAIFIVGSGKMINSLSKNHILFQLYERFSNHLFSEMVSWKEVDQ